MGDHSSWAEPPWFLRRWNRPIAPRRNRGWRGNRTSGRVILPSSVICSAELTTRSGGGRTCVKQSNQVPPWVDRLSCVPGGSFQPGTSRTGAGGIIERRCCLGGLAFVVSPPARTSQADERKVGEEIERSAMSIAAPLRCSPADVAEQAGRTGARTASQRS